MGNNRSELSGAVRQMIGSYTDRQRFEPALLAFAVDCAFDQVVIERLRQQCIRRSRDHVGAALHRAAARGDLPPDVDTDLVQDVWVGTIAYRRLVSGGTLTVDLVDSLLDPVLSGMAPLRVLEWPRVRPPFEDRPSWFYEIFQWLHGVAFGRVYPLTDRVPVRALAAVPSTAAAGGHPVTISA